MLPRSYRSLSAVTTPAEAFQECFQLLDALLQFFDALLELLEFTVVVVMLLMREHVRAASPAPPRHPHTPAPAKRLGTVHAAILFPAHIARIVVSASVVVFFAVQVTGIVVSAPTVVLSAVLVTGIVVSAPTVVLFAMLVTGVVVSAPTVVLSAVVVTWVTL